MKAILISSIIVQALLCTHSFSQVTPAWTRTINSSPDSAYVFPVRVINDQQSNVVVLSTYAKSVSGNNMNKIILNKFDYNGNLLWNLTFDNGGIDNPRGFDMVIDDLDKIYIAGGLMDSTHYRPLLMCVTSAGAVSWMKDSTASFAYGTYNKVVLHNNRLHLASTSGTAVFSTSGVEIWSNTLIPSAIAVDDAGETIIGTSSINPNTLIRFDASGNQVLSDSTITAERIATDDKRNIYLLSQYPEYALAKFDSTGAHQWTIDNFPMTPPFGDISFDVLVDLNQDVIVTGLNDTMYKFTPSGQKIWIRSMNGLDQYLNVAKIMDLNFLFIAGMTTTPSGPDIFVSAFSNIGLETWSGTYSSNNTQEFSVDMCIDHNGIYVLEDSISNTTLVKFESPFFQTPVDFNDLCVDSVWYDPLDPQLINISVFNGGIAHLNYPTIRIVSPLGDTISNVYNIVNFFAHGANMSQVYVDTIIVQGITDFSNYHFIMYDHLGSDSGEIFFCPAMSVDEKELHTVSVFPNPSSGRISVSNLNSGRDYSFQLLDINGRLVMQKNIYGVNDHQLDLSEIAGGMYFLKVSSENAMKSFRLTILEDK